MTSEDGEIAIEEAADGLEEANAADTAAATGFWERIYTLEEAADALLERARTL